MKQFLTIAAIVMMVLLGGCGGPSENGKKDDTKKQDDANKHRNSKSKISDVILAYAKDKHNKKPTLKDYEASDISGVTKDNLDEVNHQVAIRSPEDVDTKKELQEIVDALQRVLNGEHETRFAAIGGTHYSLADGMEAERVFHEGIPYVENFKIVHSSYAYTITPQGNRYDTGRYLEIRKDSNMEHNSDIHIYFDAGAIEWKLGSVNIEDVHRVELRLWSEYGTDLMMDLYKVGNFDIVRDNHENAADLNSFYDLSLMRRYHVSSGVGWKTFEFPLDLLKEWLDPEHRNSNGGFLLAWTPENGEHYQRFSSDETRRKPVLVMYYMQPGYLPTETVRQALGEDNETDNISVELEVKMDPPMPKVGEEYTLKVTANDNEALDYIVIKNLRTGEKQYKDETGRVHDSLEFVSRAEMDKTRYEICAEDAGGLAPKVCQEIGITTRRNDAPSIQSHVDYLDFEKVYPNFYRLIQYDKQRIKINVDADDSDGISSIQIKIKDENGNVITEEYTNVDHAEYTWTNDRNITEFQYTVIVKDGLGKESTYESDPVPIRVAGDLRLYNHALTFQNSFTSDEKKISAHRYMNNIFGNQGAFNTTGDNFMLVPGMKPWYKLVQASTKTGLCVGMSGLSIDLTTHTLLPSQLVSDPETTLQIQSTDPKAMEYIRSKQGSQISLEWFIEDMNNLVHGPRYVLHQAINSVDGSFANYGIVSVGKNLAFHALVPWMVRKEVNGKWRIYIYDSNKPDGPKAIQTNGTIPDFNADANFPYITIDEEENRWSYPFSDTDTWESVQASDFTTDSETWALNKIMFFPHSTVVGKSNKNRFYKYNDVSMNDHSLPGVNKATFEAIVNLVGSSVITVEKSKNVTISLKVNSTKSKSPEVIKPYLIDGDNDAISVYIVSPNKTCTIEVSAASKDDTYTVYFSNSGMTLSLKGKQIKAQSTDRYQFIPNIKKAGYTMEMTSASADDRFEMEGIYEYKITQDKAIASQQKHYQIKNIKLDAQSTLHLELNKFANSLKVETAQQSPFAFDLTVEKTDPYGKFQTLLSKTIEPKYVSGVRTFIYNMPEK